MSAPDPMLEISTALADLADFMERQDEKAGVAVSQAVGRAALEISTPIAELLEAVQKNGADTVRALSSLVARQLEQPAPQMLPAPEVIVQMPETSGWVFDPEYHPNGALKRMTARRMET